MTGGRAESFINGKPAPAARVLWQLLHGPIPTEMHVCHRCDNVLCINPNHLFLGTRSDNLRDASRKKRLNGQQKVACAQGHLFSEHGVWWGNPKRRMCRACSYERARARRL